MEFEQILYTVADGVATITLNRPDKLNAWTIRMGKEVERAVRAASDDEAVRVIVVTGSGRSFCAGADLSLIQTVAASGSAGETAGDGFDGATPFNLYLPLVGKPLLAALHGNVVGMGLIFALYCDVRLASADAKLSTAFARLGLVAEWGSAWILPKVVGLPRALDLLYTARTLDATESLALGLVNRVFDPETYNAEVQQYARHLATAVSPRSLSIMRRQVYGALTESNVEANEIANKEMLASFGTEDCKEGIMALLGRRPPQFTGR